MSKHRRAARTDSNELEIVKALRKISGVTVATAHDDLIIGYLGKSYWIELKSDRAVSKRTGKVLESQIKPSQKTLREAWTGHYAICSDLDQVLVEIGVIKP